MIQFGVNGVFCQECPHRLDALHPGRRVEVLVCDEVDSYWLRGTVTEPRTPDQAGKIRIWLDQLPVGWHGYEVLFSANKFCLELIRGINQPDRKITLIQELADVFHCCAPVNVLVGLDYQQGLVAECPRGESLIIGVVLSDGKEKRFPFHPAVVQRIWREPKVSALCRCRN